jgi:hypothetical protein
VNPVWAWRKNYTLDKSRGYKINHHPQLPPITQINFLKICELHAICR